MTRLEEIEARCAAATPGPWSVEPYTDDQCEVVTEKMTHVAFCNADGNGPNDAEFIAHAREDLPYALDEVKRMRAALEAIADANSADPDWRAAWEAFCGVDPESKASEGPERRK